MRVPATTNSPKPRVTETFKVPAPTKGWIANENLANSTEGGAAILENWFPTATGLRMRRGTETYATLGDGSLPATALFSYLNGLNRKLFGATDHAIYDITSIISALNYSLANEGDLLLETDTGDTFGNNSTIGLETLTGLTNGNWMVVQFATAGGVFLVGVNGEDPGFIYDGTDFWPIFDGGIWSLGYDAQVTPFQVGEVVTGGTSGATATVFRVEPTRLLLTGFSTNPQSWTLPYVAGSAAFHANDIVTGDTSGARATISSIAAGPNKWTLPYDGGTAAFTAAEIVTGATSGATATVDAVAGGAASGTLTLTALSGTFQDNEALSGSVAGVAFVNGTASQPLLSGTLTLTRLTGTFIQGEAIADSQGGAGLAGNTQTFVTGGTFQDNEAITGSLGGSATVNGTTASVAPGITVPGGLSTADFSYVWAYKQRLFFTQKDSLNAWYLPVDQIGGTAVELPLGGVFGRGGSLVFGATWSLDSGASGGLSEQWVVVTTEGEVAVYQGTNPGSASDWSKVGVYRIGRPLGPKAFIRAGGDLVIATDIGFVPLSQAIQRDLAALSPIAVSFPIEVAWNERVADRSTVPWHAEVWPTKQMSVIALPTVAETSPEMLVANARTGAWSLYTGWNGTCLAVFEERMFFGSSEGRVVEAEVSGADEGLPYVSTVVPLFTDLGTPASLKILSMARATMLCAYPINESVSMQVDFTLDLPPPPSSETIGTQSVWGAGIWGQSQWGQQAVKKPVQRWQSVSGTGYAIAPALQVTSGSPVPLDADLVRFDMTGQTADIVS